MRRAGELESRACPRCGSTQSTVVLESPDRKYQFPESFYVSGCAQCGLLFQNPCIPPGALSKHYPDDYSAYKAETWSLDEILNSYLKSHRGYVHLAGDRRLSARKRRFGSAISNLFLIPSYVSGGRLLEIGCGAGNRLDLFRQLGWQSCVGSEFSESAVSTAKARGLDVIFGDAETTIEGIPDGSLDAVVGGFVIEHLPDPFAFTRRVAAKLKRGGQFLFSTVNVVSPDFWLYGRYWYDLDLPRHMVFFREQDLRAMLASDFKVEAVFHESSKLDYTGSARYRKRDNVGGWRGVLDSTLLKVEPYLWRPLSYLARMGYGARIYVIARKL